MKKIQGFRYLPVPRLFHSCFIKAQTSRPMKVIQAARTARTQWARVGSRGYSLRNRTVRLYRSVTANTAVTSNRLNTSHKGFLLTTSLGVAAIAYHLPVQAQCKSDVVVEADDLFASRGSNGNLLKCYGILLQAYEEKPELRPQLCFRLARAAYNLIESSDPLDSDGKPDVKELRDLVYKYAQEAMELAPEDYQSAYWCGIGISESDKNHGVKKQIADLMKMKEYFERAVELNPKDGTSQYCLGEWCYSLADLGWFKRKLVETLFSTPPESSFEEALQYFLKAEKAEPGFWNKNALMIAKSYEKIGDKSSAKTWATTTVNRPCKTDEDERVRKEAEDLLKKL